VTPDLVMRELAGLQALARSLAHGDSDADDLIQDTAAAALAHPPDTSRPVKPWLVTVLLNRWRMDRRGRTRREAREHAVELASEAVLDPPEAIDRARMLERLASALVGLDEPFRVVVIRRYLDGKSAADIARQLGIPAATVRWRLKTGLDRLRAALDDSAPRWRLLIPAPAIQGAVLVKAKTTTLSILILLLLIGGGVFGYLKWRGGDEASSDPVATTARGSGSAAPGLPGIKPVPGEALISIDDPLPGQGKAKLELIDAPGGAIGGRVINWSTGEGVPNAELTFTSPAGAVTVRSKDKGVFELGAETPGNYALATIVAPNFLPYAPELQHSPVRITLGAKQAVRGVTLFLFPAVDYEGTVVDAQNAPVAGAKVKLSDPAGEQVLVKLATEWTTDSAGKFMFHAPDFAVFEASKNNKRGWSMLDGDVALTRKLTIKLGDAAARDLTIRGKVVDSANQPLAGVQIGAVPEQVKDTAPHATSFTTSDAEGAFVFDELDRIPYSLIAEADDHARTVKQHVTGGSQNVIITLDKGLAIGGVVRDADDNPVPAFTVLVTRREGMTREAVAARTVIDPRGRFELRVAKGEYELLVSAAGWAPSKPIPASAGSTDTKVQLSRGATLAGVVLDAGTNQPLSYARVQREGGGGGASALPANAGTVTRADGTFELTGIPVGPFTLSIAAGNHHPRLESGLVATEGGTLGPLKVALVELKDGETPKIELVGIGVKLAPDNDAAKVDLVIPGSGAEAAGVLAGDRIVAIDGILLTTLGMEGAVSRIRGVAGTTLTVTIDRGGKSSNLVVERKPLTF
jgi:RNA polymerase sigma factor (sigma-70 family)